MPPRGPKHGAGGVKEPKAEPPLAVNKTLVKMKKPVLLKVPADSHAADKANEAKELEERRQQMKEQLQSVEVQIFKLESQYIEKANPRGNALKGYDGLLSSVGANAKKASLKQEDRIFSNSSVTGDMIQTC